MEKYYTKSVTVIFVLCVVAIAAVVVNKMYIPTPAIPTAATGPVPAKSKAPTRDDGPVKTVDSSKLPVSLPSDLPIESDAKVTQNFESTNPVIGKNQSTRAYVSQKPLIRSFADFQKYFKSNGWLVVSSVNKATIKSLSAEKGNNRLDVVFSTYGKQNLVNVTFIDQ